MEAETSRDRKQQSFFVDPEIRRKYYDLSYKRYHEVDVEIVNMTSPETHLPNEETSVKD